MTEKSPKQNQIPHIFLRYVHGCQKFFFQEVKSGEISFHPLWN